GVLVVSTSVLFLHQSLLLVSFLRLFFLTDTSPTEIYTLSLHDALPISNARPKPGQKYKRNFCSSKQHRRRWSRPVLFRAAEVALDRKSTRLNSSHQIISYAVFCLKKKTNKKIEKKQDIKKIN